uniref:Uncharacterized protein n=1 Tax=Oryzias latipes TaxID=8090 RepID=A0A3P9KMI0_ORYLA
ILKGFLSCLPGSTPDPPEPGSTPDPPEPGSTPDPPEPGSTPDPPEPGSTPDPPEPGSTPDPPEPGSTPDPPEPGSTPDPPEPDLPRRTARPSSGPASPDGADPRPSSGLFDLCCPSKFVLRFVVSWFPVLSCFLSFTSFGPHLP